MRFNNRELASISGEQIDLEGRLNYRRPNSGYSQSGFKERWFKLRGNLFFYFRINELGQIDDKQPAGVFVLENSNVQFESTLGGIPFAFSITFRDEPERKHIFSGRSEVHVLQWVSVLKKATYEHLRSQMIVLQSKIKNKTGKDPLLMYPHNKGSVRDFQAPCGESSKSSFQCHLQAHTATFSRLESTPKTSHDEKNLIEF